MKPQEKTFQEKTFMEMNDSEKKIFIKMVDDQRSKFYDGIMLNARIMMISTFVALAVFCCLIFTS